MVRTPLTTYLDVLLVNAGHFGGDFISLLGVANIDRRSHGKGHFSAPGGHEIGGKPAERGPPKTHTEIVEQTIDVAAETFKRLPTLWQG